jgi:hypothetical protein
MKITDQAMSMQLSNANGSTQNKCGVIATCARRWAAAMVMQAARAPKYNLEWYPNECAISPSRARQAGKIVVQ